MELINKFDDIVNDEYGTWSQICDSCKDSMCGSGYSVDENQVYSGTCGVKDCWNEANHYIDFK